MNESVSFVAELRRRNVFRVAIAYAAVSWLIIQVVETVFPLFGFSDAAARAVVIVFLIGFIPVMITSWAFELTPEGFKRDSEVDRASPVGRRMAKRLDRVIMVFLALALGYFAVDKFVLAPQREAAVAEQAREEGRTEAIVESYGEKSIAVLPFADLSPDGDQAYFSDGIAEELLNLLASVKELRVISRSSSFALRDDRLSTPEVAEKLNVAYVLEGSVRKAGNKIRITAQLIEARSDTHLWSETYDRELDDVFAIQDQISAQVVGELKIKLLSPAPSARITETGAYEWYLRGLSLLARRDEGGSEEAVAIFEQVIAMDSNYAPAYASLALALIWSNLDWSVVEPRAEAAVSRALELEPDNSDALTALGGLRRQQSRLLEARVALEQAIANDNNNAIAYRWLGLSYINSDPTRYLALVTKAYMTNPLDPSIRFHVSMALSRFGRTREALANARERLVLDPNDNFSYGMAGLIHSHTGRLDLAIKSYFRAYLHDPDRSPYQSVTFELLDLNELDLAESWLGDVHAKGVLAFRRGNSKQGLHIFTEAVQQGSASYLDLGYATVRMVRDYAGAKKAYERGFSQLGLDIPRFDPNLWWSWFIDYALILQQTGEPERASEMIEDIRLLIETQLADGVVVANFNRHLQVFLAQLHAINGDTQQAMAALRTAATQGGLTCTMCLRIFPHYDNLRNDPEFAELIAEQDARNAEMIQSLADEGMLLTPEKVLQLEDFSFDPFAD